MNCCVGGGGEENEELGKPGALPQSTCQVLTLTRGYLTRRGMLLSG